jgi:hypothetical protein
VARISFPVRAAAVGSSRTVAERFALSYGGRPLASGTAGSTWTLHPVGAPTADITSAPVYALEDGSSPAATVQVRAGDPSPGAGLNRVEITSRLACDLCAWSTPTSSAPGVTTARVLLGGAGAHEVRVRAVDNAGHYGEWSPPRRVIVPRDDATSDVVFDGAWGGVNAADSWLGTVHSTSTPGASVETVAEASQLAVVGATGPDLAELEVWVDGVLVAVVAPRSEVLTQRRVLWEAPVAPGRHRLMVRVAGSALSAATSSSYREAHIDALVAA